jgi:hypothetical protein
MNKKKQKALNNLRTQMGFPNSDILGGKKRLENQVRTMLERSFEKESEPSKVIDQFMETFKKEVIDFWA